MTKQEEKNVICEKCGTRNETATGIIDMEIDFGIRKHTLSLCKDCQDEVEKRYKKIQKKYRKKLMKVHNKFYQELLK